MADDDDDSSSSADSSSRSKLSKGLQSAGKSMQQAGQRMTEQAAAQATARSDERSPNSQPRYTSVDSYKRGGKVRKTGPARLHKGEVLKRRKRGRKIGRL